MGVIDDISHEGLVFFYDEGTLFQAIKTWKASNHPDFEVKKNRILESQAIVDRKLKPVKGDLTVVIYTDELSPLGLASQFCVLLWSDGIKK